MGKRLQKLDVGRRIRGIPGRTINSLIDEALLAARKGEAHGQAAPGGGLKGAARIRIVNDTGALQGKGKVLALGEPMIDPADREGTVYEGVQFMGTAPALDDLHVAVLEQDLADGQAGPAFIPAAAWARVNVTNAAHEFAEVDDGETLLVSGLTGRFPIIWKPSGTGEAWCVISIVPTPTNRGLITAWVVTEISAATSVAETNWGAGTVQLYDADGVKVGDPLSVDNEFPTTFAVETLVKLDPNYDPYRVVTGSCDTLPEPTEPA